jgi:hypothetical protein
MAVKDAMERNRVPKMHAYHDHVFVILHAPERGEHGHVHYIELDQFIGVRYLVTVHGPVNPAVHPDVAQRETRSVLERIQAGRLRPVTPSQLSHSIVTVLTREQEDFPRGQGCGGSSSADRWNVDDPGSPTTTSAPPASSVHNRRR